MIKFNINNGRSLEVDQIKDDDNVYVSTYVKECNEDVYRITPDNFVMLNYYKHG